MLKYREIYRADGLPVFQNRTFHSREAAIGCVKGDVALVQDLETGLIFNRAFEPALMQYDADYNNEQANSEVFRHHLEAVATLIARHFEGLSLVEIGCGKGHFLEQMQAMGFEITGLDPTYEGSNPAVIRQYFTHETGLKAEGIVLRHVLEHVPDPVAFLQSIRDANGGSGKIYIEVPCFDWICDHRAWFDIFYEHVNYFRLSDFERMFGVIHEAGRTFNGQYLSVVAEMSTLRVPVYDEHARCEFPDQFAETIERHAARLRSRNMTRSSPAAIWGGASKGVIFSLFMQRAGASVRAAIDINPAKQRQYLPASGLQVWSPEAALRNLPVGSDIFVMNSNYLHEVEALTGHRYNYLTVDQPRRHENI
jgi:SAM-dependent methyltransferase